MPRHRTESSRPTAPRMIARPQGACDATGPLPQTLMAELDAGGTPVRAFKSALIKLGDDLTASFERGAPAHELVRGRASAMDELLVLAWRNHQLLDQPAVALVAVGGYGRGELHPGSDVDIMLLLRDAPDETLSDRLRDFLTFLWDVGIEVGHSVRTLEDCVAQASADITVVTNLMEARLLAGDEALYTRMREATGPAKIWPSGEFFSAKMAEQNNRHQRYHDTAYNLEPNVKEGPGGLRDIQMIGWVFKRHFSTDTVRELVAHGLLTDQEYRTWYEGREFLWRVRFALHTLAGRREERLLFDHQRAVAEMFGHGDHRHNLAVEQFMKRYYRTINALQRLNEMLLELFREIILLAEKPREITVINRRFRTVNGVLDATDEQVFRRHPLALLELFLILQMHPEITGVRATTIRLVRDNLHRIDDAFRADFKSRSLFLEILRQPRGITHEFRRMHEYGVLAAYLPVFEKIVGLMQYDLYHAYTVDQHTLFVVRNLRAFTVDERRHEFPFCSSLMRRQAKPELLYIAGLFHDIAKGRGGDHAKLGAVEVIKFCEQHGLGAYDTKLVSWLVALHLDMSRTAQREDISDPDVINRFAAKMGDQRHLDALYLLTVADIYGTNPKLWNDWRDNLLRELYSATARALRRGLDNPVDADELIQETVSQTRSLLSMDHGIDVGAAALWSTLGEDYFLRHTADEIAWHTRAIMRSAEQDLPIVLVRGGRGGAEVFLYAQDRANFFAATAAALDRLDLTIVDSRIITADNGMTLDSYVVLDANDAEIDSQRHAEIRTHLKAALEKTKLNVTPAKKLISRQHKHFRTPTRVNFLSDDSFNRSRMEVITADRPGLLSVLGEVFVTLNVVVHNAKIVTIGERAEDVFYLSEANGDSLREETRARLADSVAEALNHRDVA